MAQPIPDTVYVVFSSEVTPQSAATLLATMADCANKRVKTVYFALSTLGGDVAQGMAIYNTLRGHLRCCFENRSYAHNDDRRQAI